MGPLQPSVFGRYRISAFSAVDPHCPRRHRKRDVQAQHHRITRSDEMEIDIYIITYL